MLPSPHRRRLTVGRGFVLHEHRFVELASNDNKLARVHHGMRANECKQVTDGWKRLANPLGSIFVEIFVG